MIIEQISVFLENKKGTLSDVTSLLAEANINIRALSLADTSDFGILRLILDDPKKAMEILRAENITVRSSQVLAVEIDHVPGGLHNTIMKLTEKNINIEYTYAFLHEEANKATLVFRSNNIEEAEALLK